MGAQLGQAAVQPVDVGLLGGVRVLDRRPSVGHRSSLADRIKRALRNGVSRSRRGRALVLSSGVVKPFAVLAPKPPGYGWQRRLALLIAGFAACVGVLATSHAGRTSSTASQRVTSPAIAPSPPPPPTTTTTVDPKAISAGVAALLS